MLPVIKSCCRSYMSEEPCISVWIESARLRSVKGIFEYENSDGVERFTPVTSDSYCRLDNVGIGIGFHWNRHIGFAVSGEVEAFAAGVINRLGVEDYLKSVVSSEMNPDAPFEFLKAHAIISRSWVMGKILRSHSGSDEGRIDESDRVISWEDTTSHSGFDVCADDHCQRYQGLSAINGLAADAVASTSGIVIVDRRDRIADARFSKCCGGHTERFSTCWQSVDMDYLESVEDEFCNLDLLSSSERQKILFLILKGYDLGTDYYSWEHTVDAVSVADRIRIRYHRDIGDITAIVPVHRGPSGRIDILDIEGTRGVFTIGKELAIRRLLAEDTLLSSNFDVIGRDSSGNFMLRGCGWGHGVGLCQIGGAVMALKGYSCEDIIHHYYKCVRLKKIY